MSRIRFGIVFILLVLILLVVSTLFGLLTYWLDADVLPTTMPSRGSMQPLEHHTSRAHSPVQLNWDLLQPAAAQSPSQEVKT